MVERQVAQDWGPVLVGLQKGGAKLGPLPRSPLIDVTSDPEALMQKFQRGTFSVLLLDTATAAERSAEFWNATGSVVVVDTNERIVRAVKSAFATSEASPVDSLRKLLWALVIDSRGGAAARSHTGDISGNAVGEQLVAEEAPSHWFGTLVSEKRTVSESEALFQRALENSFHQRKSLLRHCLSTGKVAKLLATSRQTPHDRVQKGTLLAISDKGRLHFPAWQFDANGPAGVVSGLPRILKALDVEPIAKAIWLTRSNPVLQGLTPLQALKQGEVARVESEASAVVAQAGGHRGQDSTTAS